MNKALLSRITAALIISFPVGLLSWYSQQSDLNLLQNDVSAYIAQQKDLYAQSYIGGAVVIFILLLLTVLCIEGVSYLLLKLFVKR